MLSQEKKSKKIVITGGHATPAVACIDELRSRGYESIFYIGQEKSILFDKKYSSEYRLITQKVKVKFLTILAGKLSLYFSFSSLVWLLRLPIGFLQAFYYLLKIKPDLILTFGSHVGVPIVFCGWLLRIPIIAHEQTTTFGRSNKFIQKFANKVCLSWESIYSLVSNDSKYILTGNPIRKEIKNFSFEAENSFEFSASKTVLLITGGNQGAHTINEWIFKNLEKLVEKYNVIHQTGSNSIYNDFGKAESIYRKVNAKSIQYHIRDYIFPEEMAEAMNKADLIISRAGANALIEFAYLKKKALLIPIPTSSGNEQFLNAKVLEELGIAITLDQEHLNEADLLLNLEKLMWLKPKVHEIDKFNQLHQEAEKKIIDLVEELLITNMKA
jgi:UDP-N-acetylglucosamine--N-acetylmuramyl-(pentapeptide) pyrophosphoryl-undecaprenol N-acetylglucosamine transferase